MFADDNRLIITAGGDKVHVWGSESGRKLATSKAREKLVNIAVSHNAHSIGITYDANSSYIWNIPQTSKLMDTNAVIRLAQLSGNAKLNSDGVLVFLEEEECRAYWQTLRQKAPNFCKGVENT